MHVTFDDYGLDELSLGLPI